MSDLDNKINEFKTDMTNIATYANGDESTTVTLGGIAVPSVRKQYQDYQLFLAGLSNGLSNLLRVDTPSQGLTQTQQNNAKTNLGISHIDDTSDLNKPISTATATALSQKQATSEKDASNGYVGMTLRKINFTNTAGNFVSHIANSNTASREYVFPDKDGTVAMLSDISGTSTGVNTGDETTGSILSKLGVSTLSGSNTGDETLSTIKTKLGVSILSGSNTGDETFGTITSKLGFTPINPNIIGAANGLVPLDATSKIAATYLPAYVDDVLEYPTLANFPTTGTGGIIYITQDNNKSYRWSGSIYTEISSSPGSTDAVTEGSSNLYFTNGRAIAAPLTGLSTATNAVITSSDSILTGVGKLQKQVSDVTAAKDTSGGYAGLTLFKINFRNAANTFTSFLQNTNTAARTYTYPDKDGTIAMLSDITSTGNNTGDETQATILSKLGIPSISGTNTGDETTSSIKTKLGIATLSGSNTGDQTLGSLGAEATANKDATGGYVGLTLFKINFKNTANTITSYFTNANTVSRTYTFPDKDGTIATLADITSTGSNTGDETQSSILSKLGIPSISGTNTGDETSSTIKTKLGIATLSGSNTGDETQSSIVTKLGFTPVNPNIIGAANGLVPLDGTSKIAATYLPAYVDDVLEYVNLAGFPGTGSSGIIYVAQNTNKTYRWSGSAYTEISASPGSTDAVTEGSTNLYFNTSRVLGTALTGLSTATNAVITVSDTVLSSAGKLQKQVSDIVAAKDTSNGYAGLTLMKINFKNVANTFTSFMTNSNTSARTYTFPDKDGTVAMLSDVSGTNSGTNTGDETQATILSKLGIASISGTNTGDETTSSIKTKLGITTLSGSNTGDQTLGSLGAEATANKDATGGYVGLTLFKINFKNSANTFTSFMTNANTAARTYTFPDKDGTIATIADITGVNSGTNTGDETASSIRTKLGITTLSGSNTGDQTLVSLAAEGTANKDASNGYVGLTLMKINFKNTANTFTSFFVNANTAGRTYTFPDKDITVAGLADITGVNSGTNTGDETTATIRTKLGITTLSGSNTGDETQATIVTKLGFTPVNPNIIGAANGLVPLDGTSKIAATYLPAYVDDVLEFTNLAGFPGTGTSGIIYVAQNTNKTYRWSGSAYTEISASPGSTDAVTEGATNLYFTGARVLGQVLTGLSAGTNTAIASSDTVLGGMAKLQAQVTAQANAEDASNGYAGLTLFKINFKNTANTFTSFMTNANTAARTYTYPDKDGTVAMTSDITGVNSGTNTGDETTSSIKTKLGITTLSGSNTGDQTLGSLGAEATASKDASNGYVGLTLQKINFKNVAGTFTSFMTNTNTAVRTYTYPDKDGTVAMTSDIANQPITLSGAVSGTGTTAITTTLGTNVVGLTNMAQIATASFLGRTTATTGNVEVLSASTARTMLSIDQVNNTSDANKPVSTAQAAANNLRELLTNKVNEFSTVNNTLYPTVQAVKTYVDTATAGLLDLRGIYNASVNTWPTTGGSGTSGAVVKGDLWYVSVAGTLGGKSINIGDSFFAIIDTPGQTASNWNILESNLGFVPYNSTNPSGFISSINSSMVTTALGYTPARNDVGQTFTGGNFATQTDKGTVSSGTVTFNVSAGNFQKVTVGGAITAAFTGWPAAGIWAGIQLTVVNGGSAIFTWPTIEWILPTTGAPAASFAAYMAAIGRNPAAMQTSGKDYFVIWSDDGGATLKGKIM